MKEATERRSETIYERAGKAALKALSNGSQTFSGRDAAKVTHSSMRRFFGNAAWRKVQRVLDAHGLSTVLVTEFCIDNYSNRPCTDKAEARKCSPFQSGGSPAFGVRVFFDGDLVATVACSKQTDAALASARTSMQTVREEHDARHITTKPALLCAEDVRTSLRPMLNEAKSIAAGDRPALPSGK